MMEQEAADESGQFDCRGVPRGTCLATGCQCDGYNGGSTGKKCVICKHPPGRHQDLRIPVSGACGNRQFDSPVVDRALGSAFPSSEPSLFVEDLEESDMMTTQFLDQIPLDETCILPGCSRRKYKEQDRVHQYCGLGHAQQHKTMLSASISPELRCKTPGCTNARYQRDDRAYFDYCSLYCRDNQQQGGQAMLEPGICSLPNCGSPKYQDPSNGRIHEFCSRTHALAGAKLVSRQIRISQASAAETSAITQKFTSQWAQGKGKCPSVDWIFSISNTKLKQRWDTYRSKLPITDVEEHFHGTRLECNITSTSTLCTSEQCGICGIVNIGFDRRCIRKNIQFQRFGHGFYLAPQSSKCHDYTQGKCGYRAMILCDVCPGNKYTIQTDEEKFTAPPEGYNSVYGQPGKRLNYGEIVIYNPDGALPKYIIVYRRDGEKKIAQ